MLICFILNLCASQSSDDIQSSSTNSAVHLHQTDTSTNPTLEQQTSSLSSQSSSNQVTTPTASKTQATTTLSQTTTTVKVQTTKLIQSQASIPSSSPNLLKTSDTTTNQQENTTQNPDFPTRNPQSPSRPWDCSKFRITYLPQTCCSLPKLQIYQQVIEKCKNECKNQHCCIVECKYREMGIYKNKQFNDQALLTAYKNSLNNEAVKMNWTNAMNLSLEFCESLVLSVTTLRTTTVNSRKNIVTMTTSSRAKPATLSGTGKQTTTKSVSSTTSTSSTTSEMTTSTATESTESVKDRRDKNLYCNIPVYVYLMVSCIKIQNFINCPNFKSNDDVCDEWRDYLRKCRHELGFQL